jgi:hypothetical protein
MESKTSVAALLDEFLDPVAHALGSDAARQLVELRANPRLQAEMDVLAEKANEGKLTNGERSRYELLIMVGSMVAVLQGKALRRLGGS